MRDGASTLNARTRLRADGHAAEPHQHGHRTPDRPGRRRPRRDLERRPQGAGDRAGRRRRSGRVGVLDRPRDRPARPRSSRPRRSSPSGVGRGPTRWTATRSATTPTAPCTRSVRRDVLDNDRAFTFVHLGHTDVVGHASGWMSPAYLDAVRAADAYVGRILDAIAGAGETGETLVVVTADHGGRGRTHAEPRALRRLPDPLPRRRTRRAGGDRPLRPQPRLPRPGHPQADVPDEEAAHPQRRGRQPGHRRARHPGRPGQPGRRRGRTSTSSPPRPANLALVTAGGPRWSPWTRSTTPWESRRRKRPHGASR